MEEQRNNLNLNYIIYHNQIPCLSMFGAELANGGSIVILRTSSTSCMASLDCKFSIQDIIESNRPSSKNGSVIMHYANVRCEQIHSAYADPNDEKMKVRYKYTTVMSVECRMMHGSHLLIKVP